MPSSFFDGAWGGHVFERISGAAKSRGQEKQSSSCRTRLAARGSANPPGGDPKRGSAPRSDRRGLSQAVTRFARTRRRSISNRPSVFKRIFEAYFSRAGVRHG